MKSSYKKLGAYIRELDIASGDTKVIEQHKGILTELLDIILPLSARNAEINGLSNHGFERRYGLSYDLPLIRLRILDKTQTIQGLTDLTLTQKEFKTLNLPEMGSHPRLTENISMSTRPSQNMGILTPVRAPSMLR